jgi:uncharacterized protein with GYD domain
MPKYLFEISYTTGGHQGLAEGRRVETSCRAERRPSQSVGGKVEAFYFTFGEHDVIAIVDMPDAASAAAPRLRWRRAAR